MHGYCIAINFARLSIRRFPEAWIVPAVGFSAETVSGALGVNPQRTGFALP